MLRLLWKLFPRAFQHTPFLLGFGIDLGQTLLLLDQAADKSKRLIEPTQLTTGETFVMCVCVFVVGFVQANPNRVLQFGASGQFLLRRLQDYRIVTRVRVQCCRTCHTTTYSPMSRTAGETYPKAMTKLGSQELYDKLSWNCFSMNLHYSIPFIVTYSDFIIYSHISAVVSAKSSSATAIVDSSLKFGQALAQVGLPLRGHADRGSEGAEAPFCCWVARGTGCAKQCEECQFEIQYLQSVFPKHGHLSMVFSNMVWDLIQIW